jgi:hypothetical protein
MKWEARRVPFEERAPIALKTLELIEGTAFTLELLDSLPLVALVHIDENNRQRLDGLFWMGQVYKTPVASIPLHWVRGPLSQEAGAAVASELALMAGEWGIEKVALRAPESVAKPLGFEREDVWSLTIS